MNAHQKFKMGLAQLLCRHIATELEQNADNPGEMIAAALSVWSSTFKAHDTGWMLSVSRLPYNGSTGGFILGIENELDRAQIKVDVYENFPHPSSYRIELSRFNQEPKQVAFPKEGDTEGVQEVLDHVLGILNHIAQGQEEEGKGYGV